MPIKDQTQSYRTKEGVRYWCDHDVLEAPADITLKQQAQIVVKELRESGGKAFYEGHQEGYYRVFANVCLIN